ncbi:MAG: hypothetical protein ABL883_02855 [Terricaulis sp.]
MESDEALLLTRARGVPTGRLALAIAALWVVGASACAFALLGPLRFSALSTVEILALAAAIFFPAAMALFAAAAVRDSARARAEATRLADAADRLLNPQASASEAARRVTLNMRGEITALDQALEHTLARLREVEGHISRQAAAVSGVADQAKAGANVMISGMERERDELLRISQDLNKHAQLIGDSISRHTSSIAAAAKQAEAEVRAADQALDHRLTSFGAAAALISDRTQGLSAAAQGSADSALRLESALANALEILTKAADLTDAARQSAEAASLAANSSAGAMRDSTARAVDDAKQAADLIRGEALSIEREAAIALERLREAAEAAREAAAEARAAAEEVPAPRSAPRSDPEDEYDPSWREAHDPLEGPAPRRAPPPRGDGRQTSDDWTWRDLLSSSSVDQPPRQRTRREPEPAAGHVRRQEPESRQAEPPHPVIASIEAAGLKLDAVFSPSGLERIAQRARSGTQARRRAVQDAAHDAAHLLSTHLAADADANQEAMQFLRTEGARIADLLGRGRAAMNAEATRLFLLIDAALG